MIAPVIIVADKFVERRLQAFLLKVIFQQDAVLQHLMPSLNLTLRLRMTGRARAHANFSLPQPLCEVAGDVGWSDSRLQNAVDGYGVSSSDAAVPKGRCRWQ